MDGHETRTETLDAGIVLVAVVLVDLALAPVLGVLRQHGDAERLLAAVAAAFADQRVDEDALLRIFHLAALAPAPLLGRAGLIVDQHRYARHLAQALLHGVELGTIDELDAGREHRMIRPFLDVVGHHHDRLHAFAAHLVGDVRHGQGAVDRLAAGHRDRIVVKDLVGDVDLGRDRLADRQRAGMEIGAVAEVLEDVLGLGERRLPAPGRAFAAHLRERVGAPVHPGDHVVAADAAERARAFRHRGRGVVRTAGAVVRGTREVRARQGQLVLLVLDPAHARVDRLAAEEAAEALGDDHRDNCRRQLAGARQDPVAVLVVLADDRRARCVRPVVHRLLHLRFDEGALLLDDDDVLEAVGELADADRLERPGHADLVDADADVGRGFRVDAEVFERLQHVEIALAGGDDAQARLRRIDHDAVDAVRARERARGLDCVLVQAHLLVQRRIGPADVQSAGRQFEVFRQHDVELVRIDVDRCRGFDRLGDRLEADPAPGEAAHRPAEQAHVEDVLHAGRIEHRHHRRDELEL